MSGDQGEDKELKRVIGFWGSFSMGYADVGAGIYISLGLIVFFAAAAAPLALALAVIGYICTGLSYAELSSKYPKAGGGQQFSYRAFGPFHGFLAGWGLLLDYTIDITLFGLAAAGYLGVVEKFLGGSGITLISPYYGLLAIAVVLTLVAINVVGIMWSSRLNVTFVVLNIATLVLILAIGLPWVALNGGFGRWIGELTNVNVNPGLYRFAYATSLATVSYIGIESISQAAEETKHPYRVVPAATKAAIITVVALSAALSVLSVTLTPSSESFWSKNIQNPMVAIASALPAIGGILALWVAIMGLTSCYVSTNAGVIGVSRVTFAMGRLKLLPSSFATLHHRFHTPYPTIIMFSAVACTLILVNLYLPGVDLLALIASLYNYGALVAYMYVNLSLMALRLKDKSPRPWKVPLNLNIRGTEIPITAAIGFISNLSVWLIVVATHPEGRFLGTLWFIAGGLIYCISSRRKSQESTLP